MAVCIPDGLPSQLSLHHPDLQLRRRPQCQRTWCLRYHWYLYNITSIHNHQPCQIVLRPTVCSKFNSIRIICGKCGRVDLVIHFGWPTGQKNHHRFHPLSIGLRISRYFFCNLVLTIGSYYLVIPLLYVGIVLMGFGGYSLTMVSYSYLS